MVNEYAYCPRLAYLEWVQGEWADNFDTAEGRFKHRVVDREEGRMPEDLEEDGKIHARSVWLSAPCERLTAKMDLLEGDGSSVTPIDYKRGKVPDNIEKSWEADRVQVCAQGLVLRENGYSCDEGIIYYTASKTRITVPFERTASARNSSELLHARRMVPRNGLRNAWQERGTSKGPVQGGRGPVSEPEYRLEDGGR